MTTEEKTENEAMSNAPKESQSHNATAHSSRTDPVNPANQKVYEWARQWGLKPRQVVETARKLDIRVQNRLTRLVSSDAQRILAEINNPTSDTDAQPPKTDTN